MWTWALLTFHLFFVTHSIPHSPKASSVSDVPRDLVNLLGGDVLYSSENTGTAFETVIGDNMNTVPFGGKSASTTRTLENTITTTAIRSHSVTIGQPTSTTTIPTSNPTMVTTLTSTGLIPSISSEVVREASSMPPGEATEWKVIGLVVICIAFVATVIISVVFFDSWWSFLRAFICGKRRGRGTEDLVPDWEKRSWEFKLASEDGHRYPTLTSLEDITKVDSEKYQDGTMVVNPLSPHSKVPSGPTSPQPIYLPGYDPHPLEPLIRRPSTKPA